MTGSVEIKAREAPDAKLGLSVGVAAVTYEDVIDRIIASTGAL
jgi:hypothetical protein